MDAETKELVESLRYLSVGCPRGSEIRDKLYVAADTIERLSATAEQRNFVGEIRQAVEYVERERVEDHRAWVERRDREDREFRRAQEDRAREFAWHQNRLQRIATIAGGIWASNNGGYGNDDGSAIEIAEQARKTERAIREAVEGEQADE